MKKIGFIGQGWIGRNYADDFERRGMDVVRYALEEPYCKNLPALQECQVVFIAVPTPTTKKGFDDSAVRDALSALRSGVTVVIKSTLAVGTTKSLQDSFPELHVLHSPEFLREKTAAHDAANPDRNIIGIPVQNKIFKQKAADVLKVLPKAPYEQVMDSNDAEFVKYAGNCFLYTKVLFTNILYDMVEQSNGNWDQIREAFVNDPRINDSHTEPVHTSGHEDDSGAKLRGAGGHCFIKDFEAFREMYSKIVNDGYGSDFLKSSSEYNKFLLTSSGKDLELVKAVYGNTDL